MTDVRTIRSGSRWLESRRRSRGVTAVEFAFVAVLLFMLLFGIIDFARWFWALNSASEATRLGARLAVVCDWDSGTQNNIKDRMLGRMHEGTRNDITIVAGPTGCTGDGCMWARASVDYQLTAFILRAFTPFDIVGDPWLLRVRSTAVVTRESMQTALGGNNLYRNNLCAAP